MKKIFLYLLTSLIAVHFVVSPAFSAPRGSKVNVIYDGEVAKGMRVYKFRGKEYFCVREISKIYDAGLIWHPVTGKVTLTKNNNRLDIYIKSTRVHFNGKKKRLSASSLSMGGKIFVPHDFITSTYFAKFCKAISLWNSGTRVLTVERKINIVTPRFYSRPESTKIVIEMLEKLAYKFSYPSNTLVTVSFPHAQANKETINVDDGIVKKIDIRKEGRFAIVKIYLTSSAGKLKKDFLSNPNRLVINIPYKYGIDDTVAEAEVEESSKTEISSIDFPPIESDSEGNLETAAAETKEDNFSSLSNLTTTTKSKVVKKKILVLDAGHGGDDPGAVGRNGTKEKDINLIIVKELKKLFEESGEYKVILTRSDDTFIPLVERTNIANENRADIFVSVHCNASLKKKSQGFEIYFLSENASDSDAEATAILENSVIRLEDKPTRKQAKLQKLLWSLMVNEFINESSELCSLITKEVTRRIRIENRGVKQAGFYVLSGAQMPAILVECAFISNIREEARLKTKGFQRKMSDAIFDGVRKYEERKNGKNKKNVADAR